jgi:hypothetical protein
MGTPKSQQMKLRAVVITMCMGLIVLSGLALIKEPAHGRDNLSACGLLIYQNMVTFQHFLS